MNNTYKHAGTKFKRGAFSYLASITGLHRTWVAKVLTRRRNYSSKSLKKLARALDADIGDLARYLEDGEHPERVGELKRLIK